MSIKVVKEGTITEAGKMKGWVIDCEGGSVDLDEIRAFLKTKGGNQSNK